VNSGGEPGAAPARASTPSRLIYLLAEDGPDARDLASQIAHFGYAVKAVEDVPALEVAMSEALPVALVVDLEPHAGTVLAALGRLRDRFAHAVPVVFLASRDDPATRLESVGTGGAGFLVKPVDVGALVDLLDDLSQRTEPGDYRVVLAEPEPALGARIEGALTEAGLQVTRVCEPLQVLRTLAETPPDLLVAEMDLPGHGGLALARAIRQQPGYMGIPIVFLGDTVEPAQRAEALMVAEDYFAKPVDPHWLAAVVASRAERARRLRSRLHQDSLTGLFSHTRIKEQLELEVSRAGRAGQPLSFAMIDIDRFKAVNDRYGHLAGDRVIKALARVLKERLRRTDFVGRYGGEEFALIFPDTALADARDVLETIRGGFAQIRHRSDGGAFKATFSGGLAAFPRCPDAESLVAAADAALYAAKGAGRNRLRLAD